ncbi:hypothetical protein PHLCEN_2v11990 [Hermanssonia centrifuga]|uniref:AB hydrolase-1 domain-containing protein n=1 Tax=Hermanssonia centrifuga TaxID=98765 RepID=A0A2R6NJF7_9APHY|nr:hypothetical protein PHLCEN_2v11990 [Hermanssonia centrifuga]
MLSPNLNCEQFLLRKRAWRAAYHFRKTSGLLIIDRQMKLPALPITAKRYWNAEYYPDDPEAVTLICTHGTGFHKEHWEPTLEHLYDKLANSNPTIKVRDAWSIDAPNHGDAAVLNEEVLQWGYTSVFGWEEYARSVHAFLTGLGKGVDVDFQSRKLVGIGHSMGAITLWKSKPLLHEAHISLLLQDYGLRPLPTADYPDRIDGVTLKCPRAQEAVRQSYSYRSLQHSNTFT